MLASPRRALPLRLLAAAALLCACGDDGGATSATEGSASTTASGTGTTETTGTTAPNETTTTTTTGASESITDTSAETETDTDTATTGEPACGDGIEPSATVVLTSVGAVEGEPLADVVAFRGIAYAEPPTGDRRWRPPEPRACQPGITPAVDYGPVCPQLEKDAQGDTLAQLGDEDCLTLNVWTPAADASARPVLVFIHGGGNAIGTGSDELYDGARLAAGEDVVVVTLNYRLGALGWLAHPSLDAEDADGVSGNYALRDQILALRWVTDNIAGFGGDPERVFLFGQSAGAVNTCAVLGAPAAAGLFHSAAVQSGACGQQPKDRLLMNLSEPFVTNAGCADAPDVAACLRALDADTVISTDPDGYPQVSGLAPAWGPHVDGVVLPSSTLDAMAAGTHNQVPMMIGDTAAETGLDVPPLTQAQYEALVQATFGVLAPMVLAAYPLADYGDDAQAAYVALTSDLKFVCNTRRSARAAVSAADGPVFRYHFTFDGYNTLPNVDPVAFHGLELIYIFGNWEAVLDGDFEYQPNADDLTMQAMMSATWARFAAVGDPADADLMWAPYVAADDNAALLDIPTGTINGVRSEQCDFWDMLLP